LRHSFFRTRAFAAVALLAAVACAQGQPLRTLTFVEVGADSAAATAKTLKKYASGLQVPATRVRVLQETARPSRFVVLEAAENPDELMRAESDSRGLLEPLEAMLIAPADRRSHEDFDLDSLPAAKQDVREPSASVCVLAHVDIGPPDRLGGEAALRQLADAARHAPGNLRFEIWQQTDRTNHFNLVAVWSSRASFDSFAASAPAREFRKTVARLLGSLYDDRIYHRVD